MPKIKLSTIPTPTSRSRSCLNVHQRVKCNSSSSEETNGSLTPFSSLRCHIFISLKVNRTEVVVLLLMGAATSPEENQKFLKTSHLKISSTSFHVYFLRQLQRFMNHEKIESNRLQKRFSVPVFEREARVKFS